MQNGSDPAAAGRPPAPAADPFHPEPAIIRHIEPETTGTAIFHLELLDAARQAAYAFRSGQFNMLYVPGVGEVPISISSAPGEPTIAHTIRFVGTVTDVIGRLQPGDVLGFRGPYGSEWPIEQARGRDVLLVAGGLGLAPLRPVIRTLLAGRQDFGRLVMIYGARTPADLLYAGEFARWQQEGLELVVTVDRADLAWHGAVGVVPARLSGLAFEPDGTILFTCGPEVMMRFAILEALHRGVPPERIFLSMELNMQCAVGLCGRCQLGPFFVCKDGPVFAHDRVARFLAHEHF